MANECYTHEHQKESTIQPYLAITNPALIFSAQCHTNGTVPIGIQCLSDPSVNRSANQS